MNWILTIICLCIMFLMYYIVGRKTQLIFDLDNGKNEFTKNCLTGFIVVFFLSFIISFPCQLLHLSWNVYKYLYLILLIFVIIYCFYTEFQFYKTLRFKIGKNIINHIKENWFVYLMCLLFLVFSLTNVLVYYQNNYDDAYYLSKVVNQIGANQLSMENFFNGALTTGNFDITRVLNTYEITYGFFSDIFHISPVFFCRVTMAAHNYYLVFMVYKLFSQFFIKKNISQYCLLPFVFLLISAGYAMEGNPDVSINMFDGWQFQSAIWYGGSIVRVLAIPTIIIFSEKLLYKFDIKNVLFMVIVYTVLMSFSTIFLIYAIIITLVLFLAKGLININENKYLSNKKKKEAIICILIPVMVLLFSKVLDHFPMIATENYFSNLSNYIDFSNWYFYGDTFIHYALGIFILAYFVFKNKFCKFISFFLIIVFLIIYTKLFYELIIVSSGFFWFVAMRFTTSIQLMLMIIVGCLTVWLLNRIISKQILLNMLSVCLLVGVIGYIYTHIDQIKQQNWLASGMTEYGYSIYPLIKNDEMMPSIMCEVGDYFNTKEYGNYPLLVPEVINWDGYPTYANGFVFASNRIELCTNNGANNLDQNQLDMLYKYYSNGCNYSDIADILSDHKINYILVQDNDQKEDLLRHGWTLELSSDKINETYYLLKGNF